MENIDHKQVYDEITKIYDLAEGLVDAVESPEVVNVEQQIAIVESVIDQAGDTGDELSEVYVDYVEADYNASANKKKTIESATRKVFVSISKFNEELDKIKPEEDDGENKITIEDLVAKMKMIQILGDDLPESTIQKNLKRNALRLGAKFGGLLALAVKRLGDHMLGLMHVFQSLGLGEVVSAIPNRQGWKLKGVINATVAAPVLRKGGPGVRI